MSCRTRALRILNKFFKITRNLRPAVETPAPRPPLTETSVVLPVPQIQSNSKSMSDTLACMRRVSSVPVQTESVRVRGPFILDGHWENPSPVTPGATAGLGVLRESESKGPNGFLGRLGQPSESPNSCQLEAEPTRDFHCHFTCEGRMHY